MQTAVRRPAQEGCSRTHRANAQEAEDEAREVPMKKTIQRLKTYYKNFYFSEKGSHWRH